MSKLLILIFICLCAVSVSARIEVIEPSAIGTIDQWDSTGSGATKTIRITDGNTSNYIFSGDNATNDSDLYVLGDLVATDIDVIDSLKLYVTAQDNGTGNNRISIGILINEDVDKGSTIALTTSWVEYVHTVITPPGSRGIWDDFEVDSAEFEVVATNLSASREVRVAICSVQVFYSSFDRTIMTPEKDDACLSVLGQLFDHDLRRKSAMQNDTAFIFIDGGAGGTPPSFWKTGDAVTTYHKMNNDDWETGGFGVFLDVVHVKSDCSLTVRIQRYNSSCALQESTPFYPASGAQILVDTTGHYEIQVPQFDWGSGACGDELAIQFEWSNVSGQPDDSVWIRYGVADTYFEHEIIVNGPGCGAETGSGNCGTDTVSMHPNAEGDTDTWVEVGSAGGKWEAVADAVDANYDSTFTGGNFQTFEMGGFTEPADLATYDSIHFEFEAQQNEAKKTVRLRIRMYDGTNRTNFCESNNINIRTAAPTWGQFYGNLSVFGTPSAPQTCEGVMTEAQIEKIEIEFRALLIADTRSARVTKARLVICYTTSSGAQDTFRRRMILIGKAPPSEWDDYFEQGVTYGVIEREIDYVWRVAPRSWVWGG